MMGRHRPIQERLRRAIEMPVIGEALYLNVRRPVVARMMRGHVYADPARITSAVLDAKMAVTRRERARFGTAAFVSRRPRPGARSGGLPARSVRKRRR
jgi:hypothetical protein